MRNNFVSTLKFFFSPETILPFFLGSIVLSILGNSIYDILKNAIGSATPDLLRIALISLLMLGLSVWLVSKRLSQLPAIAPIVDKRSPKKHQGLILLVSNLEPCRKAILYHKPTLKQCWLICSSQTFKLAQELSQEFPELCQHEPIVINDVYNPLEFRFRVNEIYRKKLPPGWIESDVISDYVGMTAHGSVGMVLACVGTARPLQYTPAAIDKKTMKPVGSLPPLEVVFSSKPIHPDAGFRAKNNF